MRGTPHACRGGVFGCGDARPGAQLGTRLGARCGHVPSGATRLGALGSGPTGHALSPTAGPSALLVYVMDIYDPESWAYLPSVSTVLNVACPLVDVEVVQSGLYAADTAAACLIALLAAEQLPVAAVLEAVQHDYFVVGRPLDGPGVVASLASRLGLDGPAIELFASSDRALKLAAEDFELAHDLDLGGGPLLLASRGEHVFEFEGPGASGDELVDQFRTVLTRP